jgi:hypothetical protein
MVATMTDEELSSHYGKLMAQAEAAVASAADQIILEPRENVVKTTKFSLHIMHF